LLDTTVEARELLGKTPSSQLSVTRRLGHLTGEQARQATAPQRFASDDVPVDALNRAKRE